MTEQIGPHRIQHGNVMDGISTLMQGAQADLMYSDPPWGEGNIKFWQTMNCKQNEGCERQDVSLDLFITQIMGIGKEHAKNVMLIEYGIRWKEYIIEKAKQNGFKSIAVIDMFYKSGRRKLPMHLHVFAKNPIKLPLSYAKNIRGTTGMESVRNAIIPLVKKGQVVLDPCCGYGNTAKVCLENEYIFYGNELNKARLEETAKRLRKSYK